MIYDNLNEEAFALLTVAQAEAVMEDQFIRHLNKVTAQNGEKEQDAALRAAQNKENRAFEAAVHKKTARDNRVRAKQNRRFWLLAGIAAIVAIFPVSSLAIMLGVVSPNTGAAAMCAGFFLMGVFSCMTVQEFWPRHKSLH